MLNPISRDLDVLRQTLLYGMLESVVFNQNRKITDLKMFEFGRAYSLATSNNDPLPGYHEEKHLALILAGRAQPENWNTGGKQVDFFDLKGTLDGICKKIAVSNEQWEVKTYTSGQLTDGLQYLFNGESIFIIGSVSSQVLKLFDCRQPVYFAQANWDLLFSLVPLKSLQYRGIPKFPEVRRDLALLVDKEITFAQLEKLAFQTEKRLLRNVGLFDVYEGEKIAAGKKSYALNFILQDEEKTLTDKEIEKAMNKILQAMISNYNAQLR
jgi:phenylalanyl-tRNA synthetase beta chain